MTHYFVSDVDRLTRNDLHAMAHHDHFNRRMQHADVSEMPAGN